MSSIAAGTSAGTALVSTGDTSGTLQLQVNGTTPALTLNTTQALGVGTSPSYGTSGQVLTSAGSGAAPTWATPSSGAMVFISSSTASGAANVNFTGLSNTYAYYVIEFDGVLSPASATAIQMQISTDNGATYVAGSAYSYMDILTNSAAGSYQNARGLSTSSMQLVSATAGFTPNYPIAGQFKLYGAGTSVVVCAQSEAVLSSDAAGNIAICFGGGSTGTTAYNVNAVRISMTTGNITGNFRLYGVAKA